MLERYHSLQQDYYKKLDKIYNQTLKILAFSHTQAVCDYAFLLAMKEKLDVELCLIAALLHDGARYLDNQAKDHALYSSRKARRLLEEDGRFSEQEIETIASAIALHSNKKEVDSPYDEVIKNADALAHFQENGSLEGLKKSEQERVKKILQQL